MQQPVVYCDHEGDVWIGSAQGSVILYKTEMAQFFNIPVQLAPYGRMQNKFIGGFIQDRKNNIWVSTSYGIYLLDKNTLSAKPFRIEESGSNERGLNACTSLFETERGSLLCGTWDAGFLIFDQNQNSFRPFYDNGVPVLPANGIFQFGQHHENIFF